MGSLVAGCRRWVPAGRAGGEREAFRERQPGDGEEPLGMKVSIRRPEPSMAAEEQPGGCVWRATKERVLGLQLAGRGDISQGEVSEKGLEGQGWGFSLPLGTGTPHAGSQPGAGASHPEPWCCAQGRGSAHGGARMGEFRSQRSTCSAPKHPAPPLLKEGKTLIKRGKKIKKSKQRGGHQGKKPFLESPACARLRKPHKPCTPRGALMGWGAQGAAFCTGVHPSPWGQPPGRDSTPTLV